MGFILIPENENQFHHTALRSLANYSHKSGHILLSVKINIYIGSVSYQQISPLGPIPVQIGGVGGHGCRGGDRTMAKATKPPSSSVKSWDAVIMF